MKLNHLPTVTKGKKPDANDFPLKNISYSKMVKFSTNPIMFKINYLNGDTIESTTGITGVIGKAFHIALQIYYGGSDTQILTSEAEGIQYGLQAGTEFLENYNEGFIRFSTTIPTKQKALEKFVFLFQSYIKECPYDPEKQKTVAIEEMIEEYIDVEWKDQKISLPIKLKGYLDKIYEEKGELCIEDYKTVSVFSDPEKIDGAKMLQAVEYFFLVFAKYGRAPEKIVFSETKMTVNQDKTAQVRKYAVVYEENQLFFDFYFRFYFDIIRAINGDAVFVPNIYTLFDSEVSLIAYIHRLDEPAKLAEQMKKLKAENITDLLKKQIQNASSMKTFLVAMQKTFQSYKSLDYHKMTLPEKIKTKLMEFGILVNFDSQIVGHSVTLYRFDPAMGVKMKTIEGHIKDIEQVVGVSGIRILAPIPNTHFVGFEVPNKTRTFVDGVPAPKGFELAIGVDIEGNTKYFDIREAPHMLVAGATGSGKSVFINSLIHQLSSVPNSELYLFDPKVVELAKFKNYPRVKEYLTDTKDIAESLENLVTEMNVRYEKLSQSGARNIEEYGGRMGYKFVFIDEYGDLTLRSTVEQSVLLLAQKARACGIHLILSTQRPSVDIISGVIKANFPTKVAFRMSKETDSRVLIDQMGAERLLGKGDMLFSDHNGIQRLQGFNI